MCKNNRLLKKFKYTKIEKQSISANNAVKAQNNVEDNVNCAKFYSITLKEKSFKSVLKIAENIDTL